ncbi:MAG TPA: hypothetical protein VLU25_19755, partial [Acidobacteriota bacterium]|nr:hypothetical protein [Acidobacteriota bacterium]
MASTKHAYRDVTPGVNLEFLRSPHAGGFQGAVSERGIQIRWEALLDRLKEREIFDRYGAKLRRIEVEVRPGPGTGSRAGRDRIIIDDGHLRAAALFAYAVARLVTDQQIGRCFTLWFDNLIDALVEGDPVVHLDEGYSKLLIGLKTGRGPRDDLTRIFMEINFGWIAFLLAHEAAHILLDHGEKITKAFPGLPDDPLQWPRQAAQMTQRFELEADETAVRLCQDAEQFSYQAIAASCQWQMVRHVALAARVEATIPETHPTPDQRLSRVLSVCAGITQGERRQLKAAAEAQMRLFKKYDKALRRGKVAELFPMRRRPAEMLSKKERALKRMTLVQFCLDQEGAG